MNHLINNLLSRTGDVALKRRAKWILTQVSEKNPKSILDVGCGDGFYLHLFSQLFPESKLVGVDSDTNALKSAKRNLKRKKILLKQGDICNLNFKDNSFDVVLASEVLEHLEDDAKGVKEIYRVLKPGGLFLLSVPHIDYPILWDPVNWIAQRLFNTHIKNGFWAGIWNQHIRLYSYNQIIYLLKVSKFKRISGDILTHICLPFNHYLLNIFARILAAKPSIHKHIPISKFTGEERNKGINPFAIVFFIDQFNEIFKSDKKGVSIVASATKI